MSQIQLVEFSPAVSRLAYWRQAARIAARARAVVASALLVALAGWGLPQARAQAEESTPFAPEALASAPAPSLPQKFGLPELTPRLLGPVEAEDHWITFRAGLVIITDYAAFDQDPASISQVGQQKDQWDTRALRLVFVGTLLKQETIGYLIAGDYNGFDEDPEANWNVLDASLYFLLGSPATRLTVGKMKETFNYEMVGDAAFLPQQERVLNPFFVSRNIGVRLNQVFGADQRMTAAVGIFNDWFRTDDSFANSGTDVTARFTRLAWYEHDGKSFLHLGVAVRYAGADNNTLRYRARPESNVSDYYVDTGNLTGDHAWHTGLEVLWNEGPFSVLAEYNRAQVNSSSAGNPQFYGYYLTGSWVLTGETRTYDRMVGYARRIMPTQRWGAPELVARFSHMDLNSGTVQGGTFDKTYLGINWWASTQWKFGFGWGRTWLHRFGTTGITNNYLTRIQWFY